MDNPYRSPAKASEDLPHNSTVKFWQRFVVLLFVAILLNFSRLLLTWGVADAYEQIGFPFVAFKRGGFSYSETIYWRSIGLNSIVALSFAYFGAHLLRDGLYAAFRKLQRWGNEDVT